MCLPGRLLCCVSGLHILPCSDTTMDPDVLSHTAVRLAESRVDALRRHVGRNLQVRESENEERTAGGHLASTVLMQVLYSRAGSLHTSFTFPPPYSETAGFTLIRFLSRHCPVPCCPGAEERFERRSDTLDVLTLCAANREDHRQAIPFTVTRVLLSPCHRPVIRCLLPLCRNVARRQRPPNTPHPRSPHRRRTAAEE